MLKLEGRFTYGLGRIAPGSYIDNDMRQRKSEQTYLDLLLANIKLIYPHREGRTTRPPYEGSDGRPIITPSLYFIDSIQKMYPTRLRHPSSCVIAHKHTHTQKHIKIKIHASRHRPTTPKAK